MQEDIDIIVIGGGVSGLGVALEASARGFRVAILEQGELAQATSANSLRIIHGGLRYLQQLDVSRVIESSNEQSRLSKKYPEFFRPLPCVMPLTRFGPKSAFPMRIASRLYEWLTASSRESKPAVEVLARNEIQGRIPALQKMAPHGAFLWHDLLLIDHASFVFALKEEIEQRGVIIKTMTRVVEIVLKDLWTVRGEDGLEISAPVVINASGPWASRLIPEGAPSRFHQLPNGWCAALNLEFDFTIDPETAMACQSESGRLLFLVPRGAGSALGTWYYPHHSLCRGELLEKNAEAEIQIEKFIAEARHAFQDSRFERARVTHIDAGVLPMKRSGAKGPELYGRHSVQEWKGYIHLMSTKYTTFRLVGEEATRLAMRYLK